jgi:iron complex transport system substrate-binding protein
VTFECDYPPAARTAAIVSTSTLPAGLTPEQIDAHVSAALARGEDLYHLDRDALSNLDADLVVTQDLCAVCAVDLSVVDDALDYLGCTAEVVTIDPHTLDEVFDSILRLGTATGHTVPATALVHTLHGRLTAVDSRRSDSTPRPRVAVLEWTDPPYTPGHWVPDMVEAAGGTSVLGTAGQPSQRTTWATVIASRPDLTVVAPCGYDLAGATRLTDELVASGVLPPGVPVLPVDANASWARPGPRLVDGIEQLAEAIDQLALPRHRPAN